MGDIEHGVRCFNDPRQEEVGLLARDIYIAYCKHCHVPQVINYKYDVSFLRRTLCVYETHCTTLA